MMQIQGAYYDPFFNEKKKTFSYVLAVHLHNNSILGVWKC